MNKLLEKAAADLDRITEEWYRSPVDRNLTALKNKASDKYFDLLDHHDRVTKKPGVDLTKDSDFVEVT